MKYGFYRNRIYHYFFLFLNICLSNCLVEIPLKPIGVKGVAKYTNIKIKEPSESSSKKKIFIKEGVTVLNWHYLFLTNITIGSNDQEFNLLLDTGSNILWVPEKGSSDKAKINNHYDPSASTTKNKTQYEFEIKYISGSCKGYYYVDDIKYIDNKRFKMLFGVANTTVFDVNNADGIIGLSNYYPYDEYSFIRSLKNFGVTDSKIFSIKFEGEIDVGMSGKMYIGKHEDFSDKSTVTADLLEFENQEANMFWACEINGFSIKQSSTELKSSRSYYMIFDTGTNIIVLPYDYLNDLEDNLSKVGCSKYKESSGTYQLRCSPMSNSLPDFTLKINGYTLTIPYNYCFYYDDDDGYFYSIVLFEEDSYNIIGTPFFLAFHTLFDNEEKKLHFYPLDSNNIKKSNTSYITFIIVIMVIVLILLLVIIGYLIYRCYRLHKFRIERIQQGFPQNNYNYMNYTYM